MNKPKLIVVLGPTATGKSGLSVLIAQKHKGEVVSADSRQVYTGLDIGTGKITPEEMCGIPHHLLDVSPANKQITVTEYKALAQKTISDIISRGKTPILVGGTGFYIQAVVDNVIYPEVEPDTKLRAKLEQKENAELSSLLKKLDTRRHAEINVNDRKKIIRAIEIATHLGEVPQIQETESPYNVLMIGLDTSDEELQEKIRTRLLERIDEGMMKEIQALHENGLSWERMENLGLEYRYGARQVQGLLNKEKFIEQLSMKIWRYAKRQRTWFKRDKRIKWFKPNEIPSILSTVEKFLS